MGCAYKTPDTSSLQKRKKRECMTESSGATLGPVRTKRPLLALWQKNAPGRSTGRGTNTSRLDVGEVENAVSNRGRGEIMKLAYDKNEACI